MESNVESVERQEAIPLKSRKGRMKELFETYDKNNDGVIDLEELVNMIEAEGDECQLPMHIINNIIKKHDDDKNGTLDFDEFRQMMENPENQTYFGRMLNRYVNYVVPVSKTRDYAYEDQCNCRPPPFGMLLISLLIVCLFIVDETQKNETLDGPIAVNLCYDPEKRKQEWRYITYMLVHNGYFHMIFNVIAQLLLGVPLEMVHKWWRVLTIYMLGVLSGSLLTSITDPTVKLVGASGGVYSVITAHFATLLINWKETGTATIQLIIISVLTSMDTARSIYNRYNSNQDDKTAYAAHFGGAMAGLLVGIVVLRNLEVEKFEKILQRIAITIFVLFMVVAIIWNIVHNNFLDS